MSHIATLDERAQEIETVMTAAGMDQAALFAVSESGPAAIMFAVTHPGRAGRLVLYGSMATGAVLGGAKGREMEELLQAWGQGRIVDLFMPSLAQNKAVRKGVALLERASVSPRMARALMEAYSRMDVRAIAAAVSVPTLVLHRRDDWVPIAAGRELAATLPAARFVELDGTDHLYFCQDYEAVLGETQRFLTGTSGAGDPERVLSTVLFTDIVDSTRRAASEGDARWRELLEAHDTQVRACVEGSGGRVVKSTGDGALATFPGPACAIDCARDLLGRIEDLGLEARAGVHTGECELMGDDLGGLAVHIGARVAAKAGAGEILVSGTVKDLVVGSELEFAYRGEHELKGVPGRWQLFAVGADGAARSPLEAAAEHMTVADRAAVRVARRAPGLLRAIGRVAVRERV